MNKVDQGGEGTCSDPANVRGLSSVLMEPEGAVERKASFIVTFILMWVPSIGETEKGANLREMKRRQAQLNKQETSSQSSVIPLVWWDGP